MPTTATMSGNTATQAASAGSAAGSPGAGKGQALPVVPFVRASYQNRQAAGIQAARLLLAGTQQDLGVFDVPAYGYLRYLVLVVTATGGAGTSVTAAEDGPWNVLQNIFLTEPNGAVIAQFNSGYDLYLANKWGGYFAQGSSDPKLTSSYSAIAGATGNFQFVLRIPVEINERDGLGSLPNQNSAAAFKLRVALANGTSVYGTAPTTYPTVTVTAYMESWDQPAIDAAGQTNQVTPPAMNTTQFWTTQVYNVNAGFQTIRLNRLGNWMRNLIFEYRRTASTRANGDTDWPDPVTLYLDARPMDTLAKTVWREQMGRRGLSGVVGANEAANGLDNGVYVYDFTHDFDGALGHEPRNLWLGTLGSERLEIQGTFGTAGTLTVLTNDVTISGNVWS
jgi:hypothetical protein